MFNIYNIVIFLPSFFLSFGIKRSPPSFYVVCCLWVVLYFATGVFSMKMLYKSIIVNRKTGYKEVKKV